MRHHFLLVILFLFCILPVNAEDTVKKEWVTNGPWGGVVLGLDVNKSNPQCLYAYGPGGGNFISVDGAKTWRKISLPEGSAFSQQMPITIIGNKLYIYNYSTLYQSSDNGKTWEQFADFGDKQIALVNGAPDSAQGIYCLLFQHKSKYEADEQKDSHNYTWFWAYQPSVINPNPADVPVNQSISESGWVQNKIGVMSYKSPPGIVAHFFNKYASFCGSAIMISVTPAADYGDVTLRRTVLFSSNDNGKTWTKSETDGNMRVVCSPADASTIFGVAFFVADKTAPKGVFKSGDNGKTWTPAADKFNKPARFIAFHPKTKDIYVGTHEDGLFVSRDSGKTWEALNNGLHNLSASAIAFDPNDINIMYCGTQHGIFKTVNRGKEWQWSGEGFGANQSTNGLFIAPDNPKTVYLPDFTSGVRISRDAGQSWEPLQPSRLFSNTYGLTGCAGLLILETEKGYYRSLDEAKTWSFIEALKDRKPYSLISDKKDEIYGLDYDSRKVIKSTDGGDKWVEISGTPEEIGMPTRLIQSNNLIFCIGDKGTALSDDKGRSWIELDVRFGKANSSLYINTACFDPSDPNILYVGGARREKQTQYVYRVDLTTRKTRCIFKKTGEPYQGIVNIQFDPSDNETMIVATPSAGIFISYQKGRDWNDITHKLVGKYLSSMVVNSDRFLYLYASGAVYSMKIPDK